MHHAYDCTVRDAAAEVRMHSDVQVLCQKSRHTLGNFPSSVCLVSQSNLIMYQSDFI